MKVVQVLLVDVARQILTADNVTENSTSSRMGRVLLETRLPGKT